MKMASRLIDLIRKKANLHVQHAFLSSLAVVLHDYNVKLPSHIIFMGELSYVLTKYFVSCVHVRFYFSLALIFTLLAASISHFLTAA